MNPFLTRPMAMAVLTTVLSACQFGDLKPQSRLIVPSASQHDPVPDSVTVDSTGWPTDAWWKTLGDDQLNRLVDRALTTNPSVRLANARIGQADAVAALAGAALDPRLDGVLAMTRQRFSADGTTPPPVAGTWKNVNQAQLGLHYELDFWGRNDEALAGAVGRKRAAEIDAAAARLMLSVAVVQVYVALQTAYEQIDIEQQLLRQQQAILDLTQKRFHADLDSQVDLKQAASTVPARRAAIAELEEGKELLENQLVALTGAGSRAEAAIARPHMALPESVAIPSSLPAELIGRRPDVIAGRWRVEAAAHDVKVAKADFYPNIDLAASIGLQSLGFENFDRSRSRILGFGPAISLPIFDGGRLRAGLAMRDAEYDEVVESYNVSVLAAMRDVADQLTSMRWLKTGLAEQTNAVDTAQQAADLVNKRYAAGLATYIQVLTIQNAVLSQRKALVDLRAHALGLRVSLYRALGGGLLGSEQAPPVASTATKPLNSLSETSGDAP